MKELRCPQCEDQILETFNVKGKNVQIEQCNQCKGMWLDAGELAQITQHAQADQPIDGDMIKSKRYCPQCDSRLWTFAYPETNIKIETCVSCHGLWLEQGEIEQIKAIRSVATPSPHPSTTIKPNSTPVTQKYQPSSSVFKEQLIKWINETIDQLIDM
jgi:Zn-finger nucleic acid-binding protein